jgi:FemAB-related protein (PEP-CTERM system-associated)
MAVSVRIRELRAHEYADWDAYVRAAPAATFCHLSGWKTAIERAFGHHCPYLLAEAEGRIVGVLPLSRIRSPLFGHVVASTAFAVYGGPVGDTPEAVRALAEAARGVAESHGAERVELRAVAPTGLGWPGRADAYATFRRALSADPEANLKAIPRKQRAVLRKALGRGLAASVDAGLDRFFPLYAESVRNLGTPVFPRRWFAALRSVFAGECDVLTVADGDRPVASVLNFYFRDTVLPYYGGGGREARALGANDVMYYELMCRAGSRGFSTFDFGRSRTGSGAWAYKRNFGFEPTPLHYEYWTRSGAAPPDTSPANPRYRLLTAAWSRLPLAVANRLGPLISPYLG